MLESTKIQRRQSEIRQSLSELVGKNEPTDDETRQMETLDSEYRKNETRYRAALVAEDTERREAGEELETRDGKQWDELIGKFELRQVALNLDEGVALSGATAEAVTELRSQGGYRGTPIPWAVLEQRAGETLAAGVPDPIQTMPTIDRLFPQSVAARMGGAAINIPRGEREYPIQTQGATVGWTTSETGSGGSPQAYQTVDRALAPDYTMTAEMRITRKSLKQSGAGLEQAIRRDMSRVMQQEVDRVTFLGSGSSGEPTGLINVTGPTTTAVDATPTYEVILTEIVAFMTSNAATLPNQVRILIRPEMMQKMDTTYGSPFVAPNWYRMALMLSGRAVGPGGEDASLIPSNITTTVNALPAPTGSPAAVSAIMTTTTGGVPPYYLAMWGGLDLIRDPYSDASSGGLRLTMLGTMDFQHTRDEQTRILTGLDVS
ncbi:MAG: phage major capsid protein [Pseudomonadota bacterium]